MKKTLIWKTEEIKNELEKFSKLYSIRKFKDNSGGMKSTHLFYFYFVLTKLKFEKCYRKWCMERTRDMVNGSNRIGKKNNVNRYKS